MSMLDGKQIEQVTPWTEEEELAEARAWGYDSIEEWHNALANEVANND